MGLKSKDAALSPLQEEYSHTLHALEAEITKLLEGQDHLQTQVKEVTAENEILSTQLSDLAKLPVVPVFKDGQSHQHLLDVLTKERDSAVQLWQAGQKEVERLEAALAAARSEDSEERWRRYAEQVRSQYSRALSTLSAELVRQRQAAERAAAQQERAEESERAAQTAGHGLRQQLERAAARLREADQRCLEHVRQREELQERLELLQAEAAGHDERLRRAADETEALRRDLAEARQRCVELSGREAEALDKLKEGVDVVQNALLEKEEALQKSAQLEGHLADLEASLGRLADEAALRTKQEVDAVRQQCNQRLAELAQKLQARDSEEVELQQRLERVLREKKKVEIEYDRLKEEHAGCGPGRLQSDAVQQLTERLARLEEARDQAEMAAADLDRRLKAAEARHQIELKRLEEDASEQQRRLSELAETCDDLLAQKRALTEQLVSLREEHDSELATVVERRRQLERTVSCLEQKLKHKERLLNCEIHSYETDHEHTKMELREQLTAQQQLTAKWRRELLSVAEENEQKLARMRIVERDLARRITELEDDLRDARTRQVGSGEEVKQYKNRVRELELRVQAAEKRFLAVHSAPGRLQGRRLAASSSARLQLED